MTAEVRNELIGWVQNLEDEELLTTLKLIKDNSTLEDWYDSLSAKQHQSIQRGIVDHEKGRTLSSDEFWRKHG
ncbi:MAG: hypothetical protein JXQ96_04060 [Cyclobacteriaceae bacterium]